VSRVLRRRDGAAPEQALRAVVRRLTLPPGSRATGAVDATGLAPGRQALRLGMADKIDRL
jgi:hypothetical protein